MHPDARERLEAAIARKNAERGRPLTAREKLINLERGLGYAPGTAPWWPRAASADTRPEGGDAPKIAAPFTSGVVAESETPKPSRDTRKEGP